MSDISPRHLSTAKSVNRALFIAIIGLSVGIVLWLHAAGSGNPIASFTANPSIGQAPLTVAFDASATTDPEDDPLTFLWSFGDGNTATGVAASNTYAQPGLYTAILTATDGLGGTGTTSRTISVSDIPSGWQTSTIGSPSVPASAWTTQSNSVWHVVGAGNDIAGTSDQCAYLYQPLAGDADIVVRVNSFDPANSSATAKAGIMVRMGLDAGAPMVFLGRQVNNTVVFVTRNGTNALTTSGAYGVEAGPSWLRLKRRGNVWSASAMLCGEWFPMGCVRVPMSAPVNVGLAVASRSPTTVCHATFDNFSVENDPENVADLQTIWRRDGSDTSHRYGWWTNDGPRLVAVSNALARAEYTLAVPEPGVYRVSLTLGNNIPTNEALFAIQALIDGIPVAWFHTGVPTNTPTVTLGFWTPYIGHTNMTLRFAWPEQLNAGQRLVIHEVSVAAANPASGQLERIVNNAALFGLDSDADFLKDADEMVWGSDPMNPDTDGDNLRDGDEVHKFGTDPCDADSDGDGIPDGIIIASKPGVEYSEWVLGRKPWQIIDNTLVNFDSHTRAYYTFDIPEAGVYRMFLRIHNHMGEGPDGYYWQNSFYNDGIYVLSTYLNARHHADCDLSLPTYMDTFWLTPGRHTIGFKWWNNYTVGYRDLNVAADEIGLIRIDAPDADSDGIQDWMEPSLEALRTLDRDGDGLNDYDEVMLYHTSPTLADSDNDSLSDAREIVLGTNPNDADSDHDGVTDNEEVEELHTNPLQAEFDGAVQNVQTIPGAATNIALGAWVAEGSEILAQNRRGFVEYTLNVPTSDCYRIQIDATHIWRKSLCSPALPEDTSDILCYLDGRLISVERLVAPDGLYETVQFFTPYLTPGSYTLRLFWENVHERISLKIKGTRLQRLGGPDANANGVKDWVEASLSALCSVEAPLSSVVSPLCLEGKGRYSDTISVAACGANIAALPSPDDRWYANVPLAPTGVTAMAVSFQNGGLILQAQTAWTALNMFELASGSTSTVRKGDCMKLTAHPAEPGEGTVTITGAGQTATGAPDTPAIFAFTNAGAYTITGTWTPANGNPVTRTFTVKVLSGGFPTNPAACLVNIARAWTCTNLPSAAVMDVGDTNKVIVTQQTLTQGRKLTVTIREPYFPRTILARAGQGGPILASQKLEPFSMRAAMDGFFWVAQVYPDGRQLWYNEAVAARVPATVSMQIQVIVGGVTLDDLTTQRWINRSNLTELDEYNIGLIRSPGVTTSSCHSLKAYQDGVCLGEATYY